GPRWMDTNSRVEARRATRYAYDSRRQVSGAHQARVARVAHGGRHHGGPACDRRERSSPLRLLTLPSQHDGRVRVSGEAGECALSTPRGMSARPTSCCQTEGWHGIGVQTKAAMTMANSAAGSPFRVGVIG